jgi:DNA-binding GntR family transcriptional regulator
MALREAPFPRTAQAIAAAELRNAIVRGDLAPGARIHQEATARELGISLIPVREALKTLASEGVVTYLPQRGYFVTELPGAAIRQIYQVRELVETETERTALPNVQQPDIEAMRAHLRTQTHAVDEHDAVEMIAANRSFHFAILDRCPNPWLLRFTTQLWDTIDPYRVLSYRRMWLDDNDRGVPSEILAEHERILGAIEQPNATRALRLLKQHRQRSETFLSILTEGVPPPELSAEEAERALNPLDARHPERSRGPSN